ncbi:unnamed protein product [Adineta steineri]|uniref:Uncharacterized protein n=2 Tax=Adineta steineri TaxID=433720 RepID=A0A819IFQ8_9BILA|nr:unnamed protein product [Adineta steineri]
MNIKAPTNTQYLELYSKYPQTLVCPCKQISMNYDTFISIEYTFHQVCTSVFISQGWIDFLTEEYYVNDLYIDDYRLTSIFTFQTLSTFCGLVKQTISNRLSQFNSNQYVSAFAIPSEIFDPQVQTLVDQFKLSTTNDFLLSLATIRDTTQSNALFSAQITNYEMYLLGGRGYAYTYPMSYGDCSCSLSATCIEQSSMFRYSNGRVLYSVPGMYTGCYIVESLLQSNLKCFYNQTCINKVLSYYATPSSMNITALDNSLPSNFFPNSTLEEVINEMMVEQFIPSVIYNSYYNACQPTECTYTYPAKNSIIYIVTTLIGLLGGLITVLKLIIPPVVMFIRKKQERSQLDIEIIEGEERYSIGQKLKNYLITYNTFPSFPPSTDERQLQSERISTRVYIILLTLSLAILLLYNSLINITETVNDKAPTMTKYLELYSTYPQTLICPCTQISISYNRFLSIEYTFHQVCTSVFITQNWTNYLSTSYGDDDVYLDDFRLTSSFTFQALSALCQLINQTVSNRLSQFYSSQYVSASVIPSEIFDPQARTLVDQYISSTTTDFLLSLTTIRNTTQSNALFTGLQTNYYFITQNDTQYPDPYVLAYGNCNCSSSPKCVTQSSIYNYPDPTTLLSVPGIYLGCYVIESLLQSNLECFYNQTCIDQLQSYFSSTSLMNITALDESLSVKFRKNSTIEAVVDQLMMEQWNQTIMYDRYFNACKPFECTYTHQTKNQLIYIVTTLIGLLGGLITMLKLIVPRVVRFIRREQVQPTPPIAAMSINERIHLLYGKVKSYIQNFNLFSSIPPSTDEHQLRNEKISTRLFIILLTLSLAVLLLYNSLINVTQTVNVKAPTMTKYLELYSTYSQALICPCTQISINYDTFISIEYTFHQVCASVFVKQDWIDYLSKNYQVQSISTFDFRSMGPYLFQALNAFCELINQTVSNRLSQFNSSQYVSASVISSNVFKSQAQSLVDQFKLSTTNDFLLSLTTIRNMTQSNALLAGPLTNYGFETDIGDDDPYMYPQKYDGCSCVASAICSYPSRVCGYDGCTITPLYVPGFYMACYIIESLLQSDLRCFYNQTCIDQLQSYFISSSAISFTSLDESLPSRFLPNSTFEEIVNDLMIEQWIPSDQSVMYERYFNACRPLECTYTQETKNSIIYIVTALIGLVGGLITALKLIVPRLVKFTAFCIQKWRMRNAAVIPVMNT